MTRTAKKKRVREEARWARKPHSAKRVPDAETACKELKRIEKKYGVMAADDVVTESEAEGTTFHESFEWDDDKCGVLHRRRQARDILNSIELVICEGEGDEEVEHVCPMFVSIRNFDPNDEEEAEYESGYRSITLVMGDDLLRQKLIVQAKSEVAAWRRRYKNLVEFAQVFDAIDSM